jgi:hypothetical protein
VSSSRRMKNSLLSMIAGVLEKRYQDFHSAALGRR